MSLTPTPPSWQTMNGRDIPSVLPLFEPFWQRFDPSAPILELGCARGRIPLLLAQKLAENPVGKGRPRLFGLDLNPQAVVLAREEAAGLPPEIRPRFVAADASASPFAPAVFGRIILQACLTTIVGPDVRQAIINEAARLLKPSGSLYLADYGLSPHLEKYKKRYTQGQAAGLEPGSFEAFDPQTGKLLFIAHHFSGPELQSLITTAGLQLDIHHEQTFTTRTGQRINGHVILAAKEG